MFPGTGEFASNIEYSLDPRTDSTTFAVSFDGKVSLKKALDYETKSTHLIHITGTDIVRNTTGNSYLLYLKTDYIEY